MKRILTALALGVAIAAAMAPAMADSETKPKAAAAKVPDGSPVFLENKCNQCHTIDSRKIKKLSEDGPDMKAPDLSGVGVVHKAEWLSAFMQKQEKLGGKLHLKKFKGTDAELKQLVNWLVTLDDPEAAKKLKGAAAKDAK